MRVKQGWSGEVKPNVWAKITVELDEMDLDRMLREANLPLSHDELSLIQAYGLLEAEAERLVLLKLIVRHGYDQSEGSRELAGFEQAKIGMLAEIRDTLVPAPEFATP